MRIQDNGSQKLHPLLKDAELLEYLQVSHRTLLKMLNEGQLKYVMAHRRRRYDVNDLFTDKQAAD